MNLVSFFYLCLLPGKRQMWKRKRTKVEGRRYRVLGALHADWAQTSNSCSLKTNTVLKAKASCG